MLATVIIVLSIYDHVFVEVVVDIRYSLGYISPIIFLI